MSRFSGGLSLVGLSSEGLVSLVERSSDPVFLDSFVSCGDRGVLLAVVRNPNTSVGSLETIFGSVDAQMLLWLFDDMSLDSRVLSVAYDVLRSSRVSMLPYFYGCVFNDNLPVGLLENLAVLRLHEARCDSTVVLDGVWVARVVVCEGVDLDVRLGLLDFLGAYESSVALDSRSCFPGEIFDVFLEFDNPHVYAALSHHPQTPSDVLLDILGECDVDSYEGFNRADAIFNNFGLYDVVDVFALKEVLVALDSFGSAKYYSPGYNMLGMVFDRVSDVVSSGVLSVQEVEDFRVWCVERYGAVPDGLVFPGVSGGVLKSRVRGGVSVRELGF